jgi:hypothetical protein
MTIKNAEFFISLGVILISYFMSAPIIGYARAVVADKMGDDTPEKLGFLTLHPLAHVSRVWIAIIIWLQVLFGYLPFGLGRYIPLNPLNIQGENRGFKLAAAYFADSFTAMGLSIASFFTLILMHGSLATRFLEQVVSLKNLSAIFPEMGSFTIITSMLLVTLFAMNSLSAAFSLVINCFHFVFFYYFEEILKDSEYADMILLFGPLILLYTMVYFVREYIAMFILGVAYLLGHVVGLV